MGLTTQDAAPQPKAPREHHQGIQERYPARHRTTRFVVDAAELANQLRTRRARSLPNAGDGEIPCDETKPISAPSLARLAQAHEASLANAERVHRVQQTPQVQATLNVLLKRAQEPRLGTQERLRRLRRLADAWAATVQPHSACMAECSHCCHIGVIIPRAEARLIAQEIGAPLNDPGHASDELSIQAASAAAAQLEANPQPCTFLSDTGRCTIYASRPLVCRTLHNLDSDPVLCELVPGMSIPVPYADACDLTTLAAVLMPDMYVADIRHWFAKTTV